MRWAISTRPRVSTTTPAPTTLCGTRAFLGLRGKASGSPPAKAMQTDCRGQTPHRGFRGVQTIAPSSIIASLNNAD
ncbi:MAG: hypothetical protein A2X46_00785 [Lentisphaerae bacterium GWF2_57_35]|nr:MAG: hypothetical protein A2X46_00785 [Lentisphaerae bacterium GWF2_57_35]